MDDDGLVDRAGVAVNAPWAEGAEPPPADGGVRIAELVATLSYAADLGLGQPMDHCLRQTVIAGRLADLIGATERERATTFYLGLLMNSHCHADATEQAAWFADDIAFKGEGVETLGMNTAQLIAFFMRRVGSHGSVARAREAARDVPAQRPAAGARLHDDARGARCAVRRADRAGPGGLRSRSARRTSSGTASGVPDQLQGERIGLPARLVQLAGPGRGVQPSPRARRRRWRWLGGTRAPSSTRRWSRCSPTTRPRCSTAWTRPRAGTPCSRSSRSPRVASAGPTSTRVLEAMADLADLKSPHLAGHSRGVANLVEEAARVSGRSAEERIDRTSRRADPRPRPGRRLHRDLGQAEPAQRHRAGARPSPPVPDRPHAGAGDARSTARARSPRGTTSGSTGRAIRGG